MSTYLRIGLGPEHYALDVERVREVSEVRAVVPVAGAGPHVLGVCNLRGEILPVVGLDGLLRVDAPPPRRIAVVEDGGRRAGLAITTAAEVEELVPGDGRRDGLDGPLLAGTVLHEERLIGVLDVGAVLDAIQAREA